MWEEQWAGLGEVVLQVWPANRPCTIEQHDRLLTDLSTPADL